ncbi:PH domain-containing protein [Bacillus sp. JCM 19041]|uniref:PH domain-containing protein n=1 Tax=Bacillus sp. JCM 19041 TaxID=1460637 RepID=UPI0006D2C814
MQMKISEPERILAKDMIKVWLIRDALLNAIGFAILGVLFYLDYRFLWAEWIWWILLFITAASVVGAVWSLFKPYILYKSWRYEADHEFLQLKSGIWFEEHQLVPMAKIQAVETQQGPILRRYGLSSISVQTTGSSHLIEALRKEDAVVLRNQIAHYAKVQEVDDQ